jgi:alpha-beta hydrolase superfamily lysophospholipase
MKQISGKLKGQGNLNLFYQGYLPTESPIAVLLIIHGLAEHIGRYMNIVDYFVPRGYAIYGFDQRGHGQSEGMRGYVERFSYYIDDTKAFFDIVRGEHPSKSFFILGHSVGGLIATTYSLNYPNELDGLILSGATIKPGESLSPVKIMLARLFSKVIPKVGIDVIDASAISQDQAVVKEYINDPLVYRGKISSRLGAELIKAMQVLTNHISNIQLPILIMSGSVDRLSNPEGSRFLYNRISSIDKTIKFYDGFYHEIFNEPRRNQVFNDMENWLNYHL